MTIPLGPPLPPLSTTKHQETKTKTKTSEITPLSLIPSVEARVTASTEIWARDLRSLFEHAKERFGDVSWESEEGGERIWAHKGQFVQAGLGAIGTDNLAVVYARAPHRYFISRPFARSPSSLRSPFSSPPPPVSPSPHLLPPLFHGGSNGHASGGGRSGSSLSVGSYVSERTVRAGSFGGTGQEGILRLTHGDTPELFQSQLEWLYTGEGFGDVVEWISAEDDLGEGESIRDSLGRRGDIHERRDKLGQDLTYMWRSKLYADVRIHLTPVEPEDVTLKIGDIEHQGQTSDAGDDSDSSSDSLSSSGVIAAHRFVLASRSPYFASVLLNPSEFKPSTADVHLIAPQFTPAAIHFCLGYMYAGHLDFSNRTFDLSTAFQIYKAATYLQIESLMDEVVARIVHDFCHGLDWSTCHCRKCSLRAVRVWKFAMEPDVGAVLLARQAKASITRGWAECWSRDVGLLDDDVRDDLVTATTRSITATNVVSAFRSIRVIRSRNDVALRAKGRDAAVWVERIEAMVESVEAHLKTVMLEQFAAFADSPELWTLLSGKGFETELLEKVCGDLVDAVGTARGCVEAPMIYQILVSSILLKVNETTLEVALPARSHGRQQVEVARAGILEHMKRRWMQIRDAGSFGLLETWSLKEISDEIEVPLDDLLGPSSISPFVRSRLGGPSMPRTTSRAMSLSDAGSVRSNLSLASRTSTATRSVVTPAQRPTTPEANGLRRLRLGPSASASTTSLASSMRSVSAPLTRRPVSPPRTTTGPTARSPTAARQGTTISVGPRARAAAARAGAPSPSPSTASMSASTTTRPGRQMSGPPRELLTRSTATASRTSLASQAGSSRSTTTLAAKARSPPVAGTSSVTPHTLSTLTKSPIKGNPAATTSGPAARSSSAALRSKPPVAQPNITPNTNAAAGPSRTKTPTPSIASTRTPKPSLAMTSRPPLPLTTTTGKFATAPAKPPVPKPERGPFPSGSIASRAAMFGKTVNGTASSTNPTAAAAAAVAFGSKRPVSKSMTSAQQPPPRSPSVSTIASTRNVAKKPPIPIPPMPKTSPSTTSLASKRSTTRMRTTSTATVAGVPVAATKTASTPVRKSTSSVTLRSPSASSILSSKAKTPLAAVASKPSSNSRTTAAATGPATRRPLPAASSARQSSREPSGSTDNAPEIRTPRSSDASNHGPSLDSALLLRNDLTPSTSEGSKVFPTRAPPTTDRSFPPLIMPRPARQTSMASTQSNASAYTASRPHPSSAFDPPKRAPPVRRVSLPDLQIMDNSIPSSGPGIELRIGVPCIVSLKRKRARFRAVVRYIGHMKGESGPWIGIEVDDPARLGVSTLPHGSKNGIHYFHLGQVPSHDDDEKSGAAHEVERNRRHRKVDAVRERLANGKSRFGATKGFGSRANLFADLGLGVGVPGRGGSGRGMKRSLSPYPGGSAGETSQGKKMDNPRALFVRPSEIVFVLGAAD